MRKYKVKNENDDPTAAAEVAAPAHVTNLNASLAVWCEAHCPACIAFRTEMPMREGV